MKALQVPKPGANFHIWRNGRPSFFAKTTYGVPRSILK
jgi:hypothetical protein